MLPILAQRHRIPELMDDPAIDAAEHRRALEGLARSTPWTGSARVLRPIVHEVAKRKGGNADKVLVIETGAGDVPRSLWRPAKREGIKAESIGCDISQTAFDHATERAAEERA